MRKTESARQWVARITEILQSSINICDHTAITTMEKNCAFDSLKQKLGRMREEPARQDITIGEVVSIAYKYAATDKRVGETEEQQKSNRVNAARNTAPN